MIEFLKKYRKQATCFIIVGLVIIPFLIHWAFKTPAISDFFIPDWNAGDVLGFYGVLLGAMATVGGVFLTLQFTQENYSQDVINRSLPFITLAKMIGNGALAEKGMKAGDVVKSVECYYYVIENKKATVLAKLNQNQLDLVKRNGFFEKPIAGGVSATYSSRLTYLPLEVKNVGNGAATSFSIGLYIPPYSSENSPKCFSLPRSLMTDEQIQIAIFSDNRDDSNIGDYELCISYYDIFGNQYE